MLSRRLTKSERQQTWIEQRKLKRRLISFCTPSRWEGGNGLYHISFCYYQQGKYRDEYTGITEEVYLTQEQLYDILKPHLKLTRD